MEAKHEAPEILTKISIGKIFGDKLKKREIRIEEGVTVMLMRVLGQAVGTKTGTSNYGPWIAFLGQFLAINLINGGKKFQSGKIFFPQTITDMLYATMQTAEGPVEFAFDIGVKAAPTPVGYEFVVKPLLEASKSDPLAALEARISGVPLLESAPAPSVHAHAEVGEAEKAGGKSMASERPK